MSDDYLIVAGHDAMATATAIAPQCPMLSRRFDRPRFVVLASPGMPITPIGSEALLVGRAFTGSVATPPDALSIALADRDPRGVFNACWGEFLIVAPDDSPAGVDLFRSPTGQLAAYRLGHGMHWIVTSNATLLTDANLVEERLDETFLRHHLAFPHLRGNRTGLCGIDEPYPGDRTSLSGDRTGRTCGWSPWHFAAGPQIGTPEDGAARLHAAVTEAVAALTSHCRSPVLELSGGLDSSIVAAALAAAGRDVTAINLVAPDAEGDERTYARMVADPLGLELVERFPEGIIDLTEPFAIRSPRPGLPGVLRGLERAFISVARERHAAAFVSGTGGDNVFCSLASAAPAADLLRSSGPGASFFRAAHDVALVHGASIGHAIGLAIRQALRPPPKPIWPRSAVFLNTDALPTKALFHPWLEEPRRALPGKRLHIRSILGAMAHLDGYARHMIAPSVFPLLAQPVIETCLSIPTWLWVAGGRDRAVAREAFAQDLPQAIIARRTKGRINSYTAAIFRENRERLRPLLLDGLLATRGLLDRPAIEAYLRAEGPIADDRFYHLLPIVDTEVWARMWCPH